MEHPEAGSESNKAERKRGKVPTKKEGSAVTMMMKKNAYRQQNKRQVKTQNLASRPSVAQKYDEFYLYNAQFEILF